jgi:NitT/TauT family transport system substrate-binding protein
LKIRKLNQKVGVFNVRTINKISTVLTSIALISGAITAPSEAATIACPAPTTVVKSLGTLRIAGQASQLPGVKWGIDQGCFKKYGLDIQITPVATSQIALAGVVGGSFDVVTTTPINLILANANDNFLGVIVAPRHGYLPEELSRAKVQPFFPNALLLQTALIVGKDSKIPVDGWKQLEGKKVAIQSFLSSDHAGIAVAMAKFGGDFKKTEFLTMTSQQMGDAIAKGDIDAAVINDPYATQAVLAGGKVIGYPNAYFAEPGANNDASVAVVYASTKSVTSRKRQAIKAFQRATLEINTLLNNSANDASYRLTIQSVTGATAAAVAKQKLPYLIERNLVPDDISYIPAKLFQIGFIREKIRTYPSLFH